MIQDMFNSFYDFAVNHTIERMFWIRKDYAIDDDEKIRIQVMIDNGMDSLREISKCLIDDSSASRLFLVTNAKLRNELGDTEYEEWEKKVGTGYDIFPTWSDMMAKLNEIPVED